MDISDWFVDHLKRTGEWEEPKTRSRKSRVRKNDSESCKDVLRAFTVKPVWGWLIMKGIKDVMWTMKPADAKKVLEQL